MTKNNNRFVMAPLFAVLSAVLVSCGTQPVTENAGSEKQVQQKALSDVVQTQSETPVLEKSYGHHHEHHGADGHPHVHTSWITPPEKYADLRGDRWADFEAMARGQKIYQQQCMACHGVTGRGDGPKAAGLSHPPADLNNHFHKPSGEGDGYLFWRVTKGGTVEPFFSMLSGMPPFEGVLTEDQRWDVLAFIHGYFHLGLVKWQSAAAKSNELEKAHQHEHGHDHSHGHDHHH